MNHRIMLLKKLVFILVMILSTVQSFAQYFNRLYDIDSTADWGITIFHAGPNYLILGSAYNYQNGFWSISGLTIAPNGNQVFEKQILKSPLVSFEQGVKPGRQKRLADGGFISPVTRRTKAGNIDRFNVGFFRLNNLLDTVFVKGYTDTANYKGYTYDCDTADGGDFILGGFEFPNGGNYHDEKGILTRTDNNGNLKWKKYYVAPSNEGTDITSVQSLSSGEILVGAMATIFKTKTIGNISQTYFFRSPWFLKLDSAGNILYQKFVPTLLAGGGNIFKDKRAGYFHWGYLDSFITGNPLQIQNLPDYVAYLNDTFQIVWLHDFADTASHKHVMNVKQLRDSSYIAVGNRDYVGGYNGWAAKLDRNGVLIWEQTYSLDTTQQAYITDVIEKSDGGFVMTGIHRDNSLPQILHSDVWVISTDSNGCPALNCQFPTGVTNVLKPEADFKVYPNPVIDLLKVENTTALKNTEIIIIDIMGRTIVQQELSAQLTFVDMHNYATGIYLYRISSNGVVQKQGKIIKE